MGPPATLAKPSSSLVRLSGDKTSMATSSKCLVLTKIRINATPFPFRINQNVQPQPSDPSLPSLKKLKTKSFEDLPEDSKAIIRCLLQHQTSQNKSIYGVVREQINSPRHSRVSTPAARSDAVGSPNFSSDKVKLEPTEASSTYLEDFGKQTLRLSPEQKRVNDVLKNFHANLSNKLLPENNLSTESQFEDFLFNLLTEVRTLRTRVQDLEGVVKELTKELHN